MMKMKKMPMQRERVKEKRAEMLQNEDVERVEGCWRKRKKKKKHQ